MTVKVHQQTAYVIGNMQVKEQGESSAVKEGQDAATAMAEMVQRAAWNRFGYDKPFYIGFDLTAHNDWEKVDAYFAEHYREKATGKPSEAPGIEITSVLLLERLYPERAMYFQVDRQGHAPLHDFPGTVHQLESRPAV